MVVIAIIAILASMLLPALGKARQSAMSIHCSGNMRQLGIFNAMYTNDFDYWVYPCDDMGPGTVGNNSYTKLFWYLVYINCGYVNINFADRTFLPMGVKNVFLCPVTASEALNSLTLTQSHPSYFLVGGDTDWGKSFTGISGFKGKSRPVLPEKVKTPSKVSAFTEKGRGAASYNICWLSPGHLPNSLADMDKAVIGFVHGHSSNTLHVDGHVSSFKREDVYSPAWDNRVKNWKDHFAVAESYDAL